MNWEETIVAIRKDSAYSDLVRQTYIEENLDDNIRNFGSSLEWQQTLELIKSFNINHPVIADIGCGNGISAVNFALLGYKVFAIEPDKSNSVGAGAIRILKDKNSLSQLEIIESYAENIPLPDATADIVYVRQAMHHAHHLENFLKECHRILKPGGYLITIRDHVVDDAHEKELFLEQHPLHKFYGGENAFSEKEYSAAMTKSGLSVKKILRFFDSPINYFPLPKPDEVEKQQKDFINNYWKVKIGVVSTLPIIQQVLLAVSKLKLGSALDEKKFPGRMYSYICSKPAN